MKKCKYCQKEIDQKAKKCPYCQADQRNWFARHPIMTIVFVLIILGLIGSSGSNSKKVGSTTQTTESQTNETVNNEVQSSKTYKIGDLVDLEGKTMAVNAVEPYTSGNQFLVPKSGNKFVAVDITLQNNADNPYTYNVYEFKLHDNEEYGYDQAVSDKEPRISTGTIQPGQKTRGYITFEIPENNAPTRLVYTPGFSSLSQIIIDLTN